MAADRIRAHRLGVAGDRLLDPAAPEWARCNMLTVPLMPAPVALVQAISPYVAASTGHGRVARVEASAAHDGKILSLRLVWPDATRDDHIADLDRFADAAAVMFPLAPGANPFSMGAPGKPVNAWLWRADTPNPFDVIAEGYATTRRRPASTSGLEASARHDGQGWTLVFQRPLASEQAGCVRLHPGTPSAIAFAIWDGSHRDRSAQKAVSAGWIPVEVEGGIRESFPGQLAKLASFTATKWLDQ